MCFKAIVQYLDYRLRINAQRDSYQLVTSDLLYIEANKFRDEKLDNNFIFRKHYQKIWGIQVKEDTRTAQQIIEDTLSKRGIKIIKKGVN